MEEGCSFFINNHWSEADRKVTVKACNQDFGQGGLKAL